MNSKECEILNLILNSPTTKLEFWVAQLTLVHFNIENGAVFFSFCFTFLFQKRLLFSNECIQNILILSATVAPFASAR